MLGRSFRLNTGATIPAIGLGTFQLDPPVDGNVIKYALDIGYRHIDLSPVYRNEAEIGTALQEWFAANPHVNRSDLFVTSKLYNTNHRPDRVPIALQQTLSNLKLEYLDLYLMHWPIALIPNANNDIVPRRSDGTVALETDEVKVIDTWRAMEKLLATGKVKAIGVSNFNAATLEYIVKNSSVVPAVNQIELHPYLPQDDLLSVASKLNIHVTAYAPLGANSLKPLLREDPVVIAIANKHNITPAQVLISWAVQRGTSVIPKSASFERIKSNFHDIILSEEDMNQLKPLAKVNLRVYDSMQWFGIDVFTNKVIY